MTKVFKQLREEANKSDLPVHPSAAKSTEPDKEFDKLDKKATKDAAKGALPVHPSDASAEIQADDTKKLKKADKSTEKATDGLKIAQGAAKDGVQKEAHLYEEDDEEEKKKDDEEDDEEEKEEDEEDVEEACSPKRKRLGEEDDEEEDDEEEDEEEDDEEEVDVKEHVDALVNGEDLSEEFKEKAETIFKAAVNERVSVIKKKLEEKTVRLVEDQVSEEIEKLIDHIDNYLNYIVEEWMEENTLAVESGLKSEITDSFVLGLKNLFLEHNIDVPEDAENILAQEREEKEVLQSELNEQIEKNIELRKQLEDSEKNSVLDELVDGLAESEADKLRELSESISFESADDYRRKVQVIRDNYFPNGAYERSEQGILDEIELDKQDEENKNVNEDPRIAAYSAAIDRANKLR